MLGPYRLDKILGKGAYGTVYGAYEEGTNKYVAIKQIEKKICYSFYLESSILSLCNHPNIIKPISYSRIDTHYCIVMPYIPKSFKSLITSSYIHSRSSDIKGIIYKILCACVYLESLSILHRDFKPDNILLDENNNPYIIDFGLSRVGTEDMMRPGVQTRWYRAPEILFGNRNYTSKIDVWSMGAIIAETYLGKPLFPMNNAYKVLEAVLNLVDPSEEEIKVLNIHGQPISIPNTNSSITKYMKSHHINNPDLIDLVSNMLSFLPDKRYTFLQCISHPWFNHIYKAPSNIPKITIKNSSEHMVYIINAYYQKKGTTPDISYAVMQLVFSISDKIYHLDSPKIEDQIYEIVSTLEYSLYST